MLAKWDRRELTTTIYENTHAAPIIPPEALKMPEGLAAAVKALREAAARQGVDLDRTTHFGGGPDCPPDWRPENGSSGR